MDDTYQLYIIDSSIDLLPPTDQEDQIINELCNETEFLGVIQRYIAEHIVNLSNDLERLWEITQKVFDLIDNKIEEYIEDIVDDFSRWNLMSPQPHILARAFRSNESLRNTLAAGIGCRATMARTERRSLDLYRGKDIHEFFYCAFLCEIEARNFSEKLLSPGEIEDIKKDYQFSTSTFREVSNVSHIFMRLDKSSYENKKFKDTEFGVADVIPGNVDRFILKARMKESLYAAKPPIINSSEIINRKYLISQLRESKLRASANYFKKNWIKSDYLKIIGIDSVNIADSTHYEEKILEHIRCLSKRITDESGGKDSGDAPATDASSTVSERLAILDQFAAKHPGLPVSQRVLELFPAILNGLEPLSSLPTMAPEIWPNDRRNVDGKLETPPLFIKRVYGEWEGKGLTKKVIRNLDPTLYRALYSWLQKPGNEMPGDLDLPTISQQNDRMIEALRQNDEDSEMTHAAREALRQADRIRGAIKRRGSPEV